MIEKVIKIILVEDNVPDLTLIKRQIRKTVASPEIKIVDKLEDFKQSVESFLPDIILCDFTLNGFNGFDVLKYKNDKCFDHIPLVFITGAINDEELAANSILSGASDYILKKNMHTLHEKLEPYFVRISNQKNKVAIDDEKRTEIEQIQNYLDRLKKENTINMASYYQIKKSFDKLNLFLVKE